MVVIGGIIGSGIFVNSYIVARQLDTPQLVLAAWVIGGVIALAGALCYAELGALFPKAGGQYVYLRLGLHPLVGFLYGWALLLIIETGAIAAVAIVFATYALRLVHGPDIARIPLAITSLIVLSAINYLGAKPGSRVLNALVVLKVAALAILIGAGLLAAAQAGWWHDTRPSAGGSPITIVAMGAALVPILFSYGGWQNANYVAEEIDNPTRNLPISLIVGTTAVVVIYVTINVVYVRTLGLTGLAATMTPAADVAARVFGSIGGTFISAAIATSAFGFLNLAILAPTRVYYAMAADGVFVPALAQLHPRFRTPSLAIIVQSAWAVVLVLSGTYERLLNYVVFADWIFFGLTVSTLIGFRRTMPVAERTEGTFRTPGYPILPAAFCAVAAAIVLSVIRADPGSAARGAVLIALGVPVYYWYARRIQP